MISHTVVKLDLSSHRAISSNIIGRFTSKKYYPYTSDFPFYAAGTGSNKAVSVFIRRLGLSDDLLTQKDRFGQPRRHDLVAIDKWQQESQILLRAA